MTHELKCWPDYFQASWAGAKTFEVRNNDRSFKVNDEVALQEYDPATQEYTGREIHGFISYLSDFEQKPGYVVFSLNESGRQE